jgi:hypothetical protein
MIFEIIRQRMICSTYTDTRSTQAWVCRIPFPQIDFHVLLMVQTPLSCCRGADQLVQTSRAEYSSSVFIMIQERITRVDRLKKNIRYRYRESKCGAHFARKKLDTHLLGGARIHTLSVMADGGWRMVTAMVLYFIKKGQYSIHQSRHSTDENHENIAQFMHPLPPMRN